MLTCNKCGKPFEWGRSSKGKPCPIDLTYKGHNHLKLCGKTDEEIKAMFERAKQKKVLEAQQNKAFKRAIAK